MLILGLSTFGQNPAACIVRDGRLVAFAEEERFLRIKGAAGRFPGGGIRVAAHQEEQRHHLEQQREPLCPRLHGEHVVELQLTVAYPRRRDQPVPGDHGADRGRTQEVHVTVSGGRRLRSQAQGAGPGRHGNSSVTVRFYRAVGAGVPGARHDRVRAGVRS